MHREASPLALRHVHPEASPLALRLPRRMARARHPRDGALQQIGISVAPLNRRPCQRVRFRSDFAMGMSFLAI